VNRPTRSLLAAAALVSGCAGFTEQECRTTDWYQRGELDGLVYGMNSR